MSKFYDQTAEESLALVHISDILRETAHVVKATKVSVEQAIEQACLKTHVGTPENEFMLACARTSQSAGISVWKLLHRKPEWFSVFMSISPRGARRTQEIVDVLLDFSDIFERMAEVDTTPPQTSVNTVLLHQDVADLR